MSECNLACCLYSLRAVLVDMHNHKLLHWIVFLQGKVNLFAHVSRNARWKTCEVFNMRPVRLQLRLRIALTQLVLLFRICLATSTQMLQLTYLRYIELLILTFCLFIKLILQMFKTLTDV